MYDNPRPTPEFHRIGWRLYASEAPLAGLAAPRGHAKSTAFTHDFALAAAMFRWEPHILIVSATEDLSKAHLADISKELHDNDDLVAEFGITGFPVDAKEELVCKLADGHEFRILARGAGQKLRGLKWNGRRPGLIIADDMEEDEQVASKDRREKFAQWVLRALLPVVRRGGKIRWHGTILHVDSFLAGIMTDSTWKSLFFKAHEGFDDFSNILWPEQFPEEHLRDLRQRYINKGDASGYSQEYLNSPLDSEDAYIRREWFNPMTDADRERDKLIAMALDLAISKKDKANRTSITIGGKCAANLIHYVDQRVGKWDTFEIIEELFEVARQWRPAAIFVEKGQIWSALDPVVRKEMLRRNMWLNIVPLNPGKDKAARGRPLQNRMRAGGTRWDTLGWWFPGMQDEILHFTGHGEAVRDDQFDSAALLAFGFEYLADLEPEDFKTDEELEMEEHDPRITLGRNPTTGY